MVDMIPVGFEMPTDIFDRFDSRQNPYGQAIRLPAHLNPFWCEGVVIYAIPIYSPSLPNPKCAVVAAMINRAKGAGKLEGVHTLVEASSGNTVLPLAMAVKHLHRQGWPVKKVVAVIERKFPAGKLRQLRLMDNITIAYPEPDESTVASAMRMGKEKPGFLCLNQYGSQENVGAHCEHTGRHIFEQTNGKISLFSASMGTCGTISGVAQYLNGRKKLGVTIVGAVAAEGESIPGGRTLSKIKKDVTIPWQSAVRKDRIIEVCERDAYLLSRELIGDAMYFGPSTGSARVALHRVIDKALQSGMLNMLRNSDGIVVAAFACADGAGSYLEEYENLLR